MIIPRHLRACHAIACAVARSQRHPQVRISRCVEALTLKGTAATADRIAGDIRLSVGRTRVHLRALERAGILARDGAGYRFVPPPSCVDCGLWCARSQAADPAPRCILCAPRAAVAG